MSAPRSSVLSPLRDRPLTNTPDPVQSSIRRESALGWNKPSSATPNTGTTPLRIAKREGKPPFPVVARRSSSSYKHLRTNNLVSKSPFRSQIPTPSTSDSPFPVVTRRVSGEKRPRPESMHEQAENERPFAFKRERRQSKAYQGLIEKEPVTRSPFRRVETVDAEEEQPPPPPPKPATVPLPVPPAPAPARPITPSRPSLVSKRLHGPRTVEQSSLDSRRRRRKTVTFDERCDVLEFDRYIDEENPFFSSDEDDYGEPEPGEDGENLGHHRVDAPSQDSKQDSFESTQLGDGDQSITGIVDAMLSVSTAVPGLGLPSTSSRNSSRLQSEEGVPANHAERARRRASVSSSALPTGFPFRNPHVDQDLPSTPPRSAESSAVLSESDVPQGLSTCPEHTHDDHAQGQLDEDVNMMPSSPSPTRVMQKGESTRRDSLIPRLELQIPKSESSPVTPPSGPSADLFSVPRTGDQPHIADTSADSVDPMDPANLSIGQSEVSLSNLDLEAELQKVLHEHRPTTEDVPKLSEIISCSSPLATSTPPPHTPPLSFAGVSSESSDTPPHSNSPHLRNLSTSRMSPSGESPIITPQFAPSRSASPSGAMLQRISASPSAFNLRRRSDSPLNLPSRFATGSPSGSPGLHTGSPLRETTSAQELQQSRMQRSRISREEVQARLIRKRSAESPMRSPATTPHVDTPPGVPAGTAPVPLISLREVGHVNGPPGDPDKEKCLNRMSVITDASAEFAIIETAEKHTLNAVNARAQLQGHEEARSTPVSTPEVEPSPATRPQSCFAALETSFDTSGFGRDSIGSVQLGEMRSALDRLMDNVKGTPSKLGTPQVGVDSVAQGVKVDQFEASVDSSGGFGDESMRTETEDMSLCVDEGPEEVIVHPPRATPMERAATDSAIYMAPSFTSPPRVKEPPASPTKDAIRTREELILEKRREARKREEDESLGYYTPPRPASRPPSVGRPSRRRSRSTGDAALLSKDGILLDLGISDSEDHLADSISRELRRLDPEDRQGKYRIREHEAIFASADVDQVSHISLAGDVNGGKAWRTVRRPSDMNEYAKQIKEYRSQEKPGKAHGKVFVRVIGVRGLNVPIPQQRTAMTCTLNNGIHFVTTPETRLSRDTRIDQEFELIEHNKLEFTLTLKVKRDPHIAAQFKALAPPPPPPPQPAPAPKPKGGMFSFLSSSPKKVSRATPPPPPVVPAKLPDNLARYLKQDCTLARAFISFKDVASRCDTRLFEISYPLIGQRAEVSGGVSTMELGEIVLQMLRLPALPGVLSNHMPLSLDECLRGLRHVAWHKVTYFEGTLTQNGGDCTTWRRRKLRVTGAKLIAFNDVTKKITATIDLKKAIAVEDIQTARPAAPGTVGNYRDDYDGLCTVERSFRIIFPGDQEIFFFADTDEEKAKWLEVLGALVGHIPPNPLWAELIWQRQQELAKQPQHSHPNGASSGRDS